LPCHGPPAEPADLFRHACLTLSRNPGSASWPFRINGKLTGIDVKGPVSADSADMLLRSAIGGAGIHMVFIDFLIERLSSAPWRMGV
jgi:hypothetical protein